MFIYCKFALWILHCVITLYVVQVLYEKCGRVEAFYFQKSALFVFCELVYMYSCGAALLRHGTSLYLCRCMVLSTYCTEIQISSNRPRAYYLFQRCRWCSDYSRWGSNRGARSFCVCRILPHKLYTSRDGS